MKARKLIISAPKIIEMDSEASIVITTIQSKAYPARCIKILLKMVRSSVLSLKAISGNRGKPDSHKYICNAENGSKLSINIDTSEGGVTTYSIRHMWVVSLLGLFSLPVPVRFSKPILVLPPPLMPPLSIELPRGIIFSAKPGGGFAEDHDLREYRPGDPIRSIHWKISAKFDSMIIREPLVPPANSRLLLISRWTSASERDLILGRLRWISDYLLKWDIPNFVRFGDEGEIEEITSPEELGEYLYRELCGFGSEVMRHNRFADTGRFTWVYKIDAGVLP
jgi:hypothetical protein